MRSHWRWLQLALFFVCLLNVQSNLLYARTFFGIASGNPRANKDFDFSMRVAPNWTEESRWSKIVATSDAPVDEWFMHNQAPGVEQSWMKIEFFAGIPVESLADLRKFLEGKYQDHAWQWQDYTDGRLAGFRSNEIVDLGDPAGAATIGRLAYFMDRKMVVSVSWRRHPAEGGASDVTNLIASMDRYTSPPVIKSISMTPLDRVAAGSHACYRIEVDDLKSSFSEKSIEDFSITGLPEYWIWTDVRWSEPTGSFEICFTVPKSIQSRNDLIVRNLEISNDREVTLYCRMSVVLVEPQLECRSYSNSSSSPQPVTVPMNLPEVDNPSPDLDSPQVELLSMDRTDGRYILRGVVRDASNISGGWLLLKQIPGDSTEVMIAPWQVSGGNLYMDLTAESTNGTRRINEIILVDEHGNSSRLMVCPIGSTDCREQNYVRCVQSRGSSKEICSDTGMPIVEYFAQYKAR